MSGPTVAETLDTADADADAIAAIWSTLLGIEQPDRKRSFFEQGGHSLLAVRLVAALHTQLSLSVGLVELFQGATIVDLATRLRRAAGNAHGVCLPLRRHGGRTPFFMVGSNPHYRRAAARLDQDQPVWQLDAYSLLSKSGHVRKSDGNRLRTLAREFILQMRRVQARGPWRIGGGCEGALIAHEIAVQLQQAGEQVDELVLWVTPAPGPELDRVFGGSTWRRLWQQIQSLRARGSTGGLGLSAWMMLLRHEWIEYQLFDAMLRHRPQQRFAGRLMLARVCASNDPPDLDPDLGWAVHATEGVDVWTMPGNHDTWLREHADVFGDFLAARLASPPQSVSVADANTPSVMSALGT